ncbi:MAG: DUF5663 domain-containing protein [Candidatus Saccharimonadales bacterium]
MLKIDDKFLQDAGLKDLPAKEKDQLLVQIYETLENRVGTKLAAQMNNKQLDEFEELINNNDESAALKWLETNFPDYPKVVQTELKKLQDEIRQDAEKIQGLVEDQQEG